MLSKFIFKKSTAIRGMLDSEGKPWFIAKDISDALGYVKTANAMKLCKNAMSVKYFNETGNLPPATKWISESDVYRLIMRSNMQKALVFQDWICEEVLPTIRTSNNIQIPVYNDTNILLNQGHVYVIINSVNKLVKIGKTRKPIKRLKNIETAMGALIDKSYISKPCINYSELEKLAHKKLRKFRGIGEWFDIDFEVGKKVIISFDIPD